MRGNDTIAAVATGLVPSGIGIVRISGDRAVEIADRVFRGRERLAEVPSHTIRYGKVTDGEEVLDQVLATVLRAPHSYTGEDTVELNCHGGVLVLQRVLSRVLEEGANLAEPGEFTKRAFLNGKMDLAQAEAVADIIDADNAYALKNGVKQLRGSLSGEIRGLRDALRYEIAYIEAALDDPEHYDLSGYPEQLLEKTGELSARVGRLLESADAGIYMKSGIGTVILGKPNAGKSSIYNLLAGRDRAIVTEIAGTTRDTLTENIRLDSGICLNLTDTAGLRKSEDTVEKLGIGRAREAAEDADLILCVLDGSRALSEEDDELFAIIRGRQALVLLNKADLGERGLVPEDLEGKVSGTVIPFSAKTGLGLRELQDEIARRFCGGLAGTGDGALVTSFRHKEALKKASASLELVRRGILEGMSEDCLSIDLTDAYEALGTITGESAGDEIIDEIFEKFCMGK